MVKTASVADLLRRTVTAGIFIIPALGVATSGRNLNDAKFYVDELSTNQLSSAVTFLGVMFIVFAAMGIFALLYLARRGGPIYPTGARFLICSFAFYSVLAVFVAGLFGTGRGLGLTQFFVPLVVLALATSIGINPRALVATLKASCFTVLVLGLFMMLLSPYTVIEPYDISLIAGFPYRYWGVTPHANTVGPIGFLLLLLELAFKSKNRHARYAFILISLATIVSAQSKTTWIAALASLGCYFINALPVRMRLILISIFAVILLFSISIFGIDGLEDLQRLLIFQEVGREDFSGRSAIWQVAAREWDRNFLFGYGPSIWSLEYRLAHGMNYAFHAHNQYFQTIGESGAVGLTCLALYLLALIYAITKLPATYRKFALPYCLFLMIRGFSEPTFRTVYIISGDFMLHLPLILLIIAGLASRPRRNYSSVQEEVGS